MGQLSDNQIMGCGISKAEQTSDKTVIKKLPFEGQKIVFVLGGPGSGKGTQCEQIVSSLGFAHFSTGDLLRDEVTKGTDLGKSLDADMKEGKMVSMVNTC
jgi:adenylate kinase